ncbi:hypothetical protein [Megalodesulfovibrio paquesii]
MRYNIANTTLASILDLGLKLFRHNARTALLIALVLSLPDLLILGIDAMDAGLAPSETIQDAAATQTLPLASNGEDSPLPSFLENNAEFDAKTLLVMAIGMVQVFLLFPVTSGALALCYTADLFGESLTWSAAIRRAWGQKGSLCTAMALSTLYTICGMLLFILPGIYLGLRYTLIYHAAALEGADPRGALRRSGVLMQSHYLMALTIMFLMWGVTIGTIVAVSSTASPLVAGLVQWAAEAGTMCLVSACYTALYFAARSKHEQFDQTMALSRRS